MTVRRMTVRDTTVGDTTALSLCFIGGWGSNEEAWRGTLSEAMLSRSEESALAQCEVHFLSWLECVQDWPGALAKLRALPGRCVLVGWSLGGLLALRAALDWELDWGLELEQQPELTKRQEQPGEVAAIVLVSATPRMCADGDYAGVERRTLAAMCARLEKSFAAVLEDFARQCAAPDGGEETCRSWLRQAEQFSVEEMAAGLECLASLDLRERLGEIAVPCRILHGEGDCIVPVGSAQFMSRRICGAQMEVLAGRGHALPFTAPAEIARCIASVVAASVLP